MSIIAFGGTNSIITPQISKIYLDNYPNNKISKQNLLDLLISEVWDERDGTILVHTNNINVDITRKSDNVLVSEILSEGYYDIRLSCEDNDNNIGTIFWQNRYVSLNKDIITLYISKNTNPSILINHKKVFKLTDYTNNTITRTELNNELVYKVIDDMDGILVTDMLNIRIFQKGEESSSGTNGTNWFYPTYTEGSSGLGIILDYINPPLELLYIDEIGEYIIQVKVQDSFGLITIAEFIINVFMT
jgi:hypothetical protein